MAHLGFQLVIALNDPYPRHVEVVVLLLQRRCPKTHTVSRTQREVGQKTIAQVELGSKAGVSPIRKIVIAHGPNHLQFAGSHPVVLGKDIEAILLARVSYKVSVEEIVVHEVRTHRQDITPRERMAV